ncbi:MAG TPA: sigma-70 family RNA polymerase sigma factor [Polyangiaceae bacterium]|nr:sigma-70 family RNA polymerase sigma factor [Polyangiaceae bacterium]
MVAELASFGLDIGQADEGTEEITVLARTHFSYVWRLLRRAGLSEADADDAAQQVFITAARKMPEIRPGSERAFLYRVALREVGHHRRTRGRRREDLTAEPDVAESGLVGQDELAAQKRAREVLDAILAAMPLDLRMVFVLSEIEELTMGEIAEVLAIPPGTVASRLRRARADFDARVERIEAKRHFERRER